MELLKQLNHGVGWDGNYNSPPPWMITGLAIQLLKDVESKGYSFSLKKIT
jgi:hypothetical protein